MAYDAPEDIDIALQQISEYIARTGTDAERSLEWGTPGLLVLQNNQDLRGYLHSSNRNESPMVADTTRLVVQDEGNEQSDVEHVDDVVSVHVGCREVNGSVVEDAADHHGHVVHVNLAIAAHVTQ